MALDVQQIADKVEALKRRNQDRDTRMANVLSVRRGEISNWRYFNTISVL